MVTFNTFLSFVLLLMTAEVDGQYHVPAVYPPYVCALKGSMVKISCSVRDYHDDAFKKFLWTKTATEMPRFCLGRIQCRRENENTHSITVTNVTDSDKHVYYCSVITSKHVRIKGFHAAQLDVTELQVETQQRVKEGDSVTLACKTTCRLTEETTFIWYRNTQTLTKGRFTENEFHLQSIRRHDSGLYRCALRGYEHLPSSPYNLSVMYPPEKTSASISSSGDSVNLTCSSESNPPVHIYSWFKENQTSSVGSGQTYSISNFNSRLSGWFYCVAQNKYGSERSAALSLTVTENRSAVNVVTVGVILAVVVTSVILMVAMVMFIRRKRVATSEEQTNQDEMAAYMTLDPTSRCVDYDTLHKMNRPRISEAQETIYYNIDY